MKKRILTVALMLLVSGPAFAGVVPRAQHIDMNNSNVVYMNRLKSAPWGSLSADERALRLNRDYDYPNAATSDSTIVVPLTTREIRTIQRAQAAQRARADANFKAMSADERRRFIQANYGAFRAGLEPRPLYIQR